MRKQIASALALLLTVLLLGAPQPVRADSRVIKVKINGMTVPMNPAPVLRSDLNRVYVPVRFIAEALGFPVDWDNATQTVIIGKRPAALTRGTQVQLAVDGKLVPTDAPPFFIDDRTFVGARSVAEALGADVHFDNLTYSVVIRLANLPQLVLEKQTPGEEPVCGKEHQDVTVSSLRLLDLNADGRQEAVIVQKWANSASKTDASYCFQVLSNKGSFWGPSTIWNYNTNMVGQPSTETTVWRDLYNLEITPLWYAEGKAPLLVLSTAADRAGLDRAHQLFFWNVDALSAAQWGGETGVLRVPGALSFPAPGQIDRTWAYMGRTYNYTYEWDGRILQLR